MQDGQVQQVNSPDEPPVKRGGGKDFIRQNKNALGVIVVAAVVLFVVIARYENRLAQYEAQIYEYAQLNYEIREQYAGMRVLYYEALEQIQYRLEQNRELFWEHRQMTRRLAGYSSRLADYSSRLDIVLDDMIALQARHIESQRIRSNRMYSSAMEWFFGIHEMGTPIVIHESVTREDIDLVVRHFQALYTGDVETYLETITRDGRRHVEVTDDNSLGWGYTRMLEWLRRRGEVGYYRVEVKVIPELRHGFVPISVLVQRYPDSPPFMREYWTGFVQRDDGSWRIYIHD